MVKSVINKQDIVAIWQEAFGDSEEDILYFADNLQNGMCIGIYNDDELMSMMYLVDCKVDGKSGKYVYAACTFEHYRGKGYMSELLKYAKSVCGNLLCLIPANTGLIDYYKARGLTAEFSIESIVFDEIEGVTEYLFEGCELEVPIALMYGG